MGQKLFSKYYSEFSIDVIRLEFGKGLFKEPDLLFDLKVFKRVAAPLKIIRQVKVNWPLTHILLGA